VLLTLLFVGSTIFTESITKSKYPEYAGYQATTSMIVPWFPRGSRAAEPAKA
jgi:steroid 5-alpha reductase family enzyme